MTAKHTPLPWQVAEYGIRELKAKYLCIKHGNKTIARIDASGNSLSVTKQDEANARLIVASVNQAGKLAEALRKLLNRLDNITSEQFALGAERIEREAARNMLVAYESEVQQ